MPIIWPLNGNAYRGWTYDGITSTTEAISQNISYRNDNAKSWKRHQDEFLMFDIAKKDQCPLVLQFFFCKEYLCIDHILAYKRS